jgi:hypothetical protein
MAETTHMLKDRHYLKRFFAEIFSIRIMLFMLLGIIFKK